MIKIINQKVYISEMEAPQWILDKWLSTISNPNFNVVQSMQDKFQNILDQKFDEKICQKFLENEQIAIEELLRTREPIEALINGVKFVAKFVDGERYEKRYIRARKSRSTKKKERGRKIYKLPKLMFLHSRWMFYLIIKLKVKSKALVGHPHFAAMLSDDQAYFGPQTFSLGSSNVYFCNLYYMGHQILLQSVRLVANPRVENYWF